LAKDVLVVITHTGLATRKKTPSERPLVSRKRNNLMKEMVARVPESSSGYLIGGQMTGDERERKHGWMV
jgi:hypothetical protein